MNLLQFGIMLRPNYNFEEFIDPGYTTFTTGIESNKKDVCISLKTPKDYEDSIPELLRIKKLFRSKK